MPSSLPYLAFSLVMTVLLCVFLHFPIGFTALAVFVGLPVAGLLITLDDDLPGGWSNPRGNVPAPWKHAEFWADIMFRGGFALAAFAIGEGWTTWNALRFWLLCAVTMAASFGLWKWGRRKPRTTENKP